jgi:hypothetical protein
MTGSSGAPPHGVGTRVEVTNRFDRRWSRGFEVAEIVGAGYRLRRLSDGLVIPVVFSAPEVRADGAAPAPAFLTL